MSRSVIRIVEAQRGHEGAGFPIRRPFPTRALAEVDPFLLLDEMGPVDYGPGEAKGAPDHPHRGFETVTYVLEGKMRHKDSRGNAGALGPGDVQWMTAGAGVVHSEMPDDAFQRTGGRMHGFQLWVNLPSRDKMIAPRYQEIPAEKIPVAKSADGKVTVRVIAGESMGVRAVIDTRTPIVFQHFTLAPGANVRQPISREHAAFAYVFSGTGEFGARTVKQGEVVVFGEDGDDVAWSNAPGSTEPLEVLLLGGVPLREPVARYGPFVMNTEAEIMKAFEDYRSGRMGSIDF